LPESPVRSIYREFNGRKFAFQNDLNLTSQIMDFILEYGDEALRALRQMEREGDEKYSQMLQELLEQGLLEKVKGRFRLTPRAVNAMQRRALMEIFTQLNRGTRDAHASQETGSGLDRTEGTQRFQWGDPVSEIDLNSTLRNSVARCIDERTRLTADDEATVFATGGLLPIRLRDDDIERYNAETRTSCSTVVLLDMSGSMARFHRFFHAKKTAMSLIALVKQRFSLDTIDVVGFYSGAAVIAEDKLPLLMPKEVTTYDPRIRLRVPLNKLESAPQHFTNLHLGLLQARQVLRRRTGENKMIFIITDGQPTAHVQGDYAHLIYPPDESSHWATLKEAFNLSRQGIRICTFALTDDYWDMDWLGFVDHLGKLTRGVTFHCASGDLSSCVMESYLSGRKRRTYLV
jgi:uncharacterized protein with von Willebrand factor type A (vWA) domain